jgi:DNA polymerase-3 subunit epsilon
MHFVALDFETANESMASICQVGIAEFEQGQVRDAWSSLIDPEDYFSGINIAIHGIDETKVAGAPCFADVYPVLAKRLSGQVVVSHTPFDRVALRRAIARYELPQLECQWLDSARVVRRVWPECVQRGYGLTAMAAKLGIEFRHHDALEDARAAGLILLRAISHSGVGLGEWLVKSLKPISGSASRDGNPAGAFYGECLVFTGALCLPRRVAAELAAKIGCTVADSVSKKTSMLVVGDQDIARLRPGESRSTKHRKAEELIASSVPMRIIGEADFLAMCDQEADAA